jgi:ribosome-associated translation inhibitor RaiA
MPPRTNRTRTSSTFPATLPRATKPSRGRTATEQTTLNVRTQGVTLDAATKAYVRKRLTTKLGKFARRIERLTARFEDLNGPRGGVDTLCRVKVTLSGIDSVVYDARGTDARVAVDSAADGIERAVHKALAKDQTRERKAGGRAAVAIARPEKPTPKAQRPTRSKSGTRERKRHAGTTESSGALVGRRVGQAKRNVDTARERPEKSRRDALVDTAQPRRSATDRRAGGAHTARRNTRGATPRASVALEDSAKDRPSRKSTRKSANRVKSDDNLRQRAVRTTRAPSTRAAKARARR